MLKIEMNCLECGAEMKELFIFDPCSQAAGSFHYSEKGSYFGSRETAVDVMWCPECGRIRGYSRKSSQEEK